MYIPQVSKRYEFDDHTESGVRIQSHLRMINGVEWDFTRWAWADGSVTVTASPYPADAPYAHTIHWE